MTNSEQNQTDAQRAANELSVQTINAALQYPQSPENEAALREALRNKTS